MTGHRRAKLRYALAIELAFITFLAWQGRPARAEAVDPRTGDHLIDRTRQAMGTLVHITAWANNDAATVQAFEAAFAEFDRLDRMMTTWTDTSDVSRINAAAGNGVPVHVAPEVITCVSKALEGSRLSHGAFDLTVGSFAGVWKFDQDNDGTIPPPELVAERRKLVNWHDIILDAKAGTVRLRRKGQKITLGGIAKGYAVDRAVAILRRHGLVDFIVQAGGDMYVAGRHGDRPWRVGIRDPRGPRDSFFAAAEVQDHTFSTSGDYERFTIKDGRRYHHIIDPHTGYPATGARSVTIMAKDGITAEVLSKTVFIWGAKRGLQLINSLPDAEAVVVGPDNKVSVSKGLQGKLSIIRPPTDGL